VVLAAPPKMTALLLTLMTWGRSLVAAETVTTGAAEKAALKVLVTVLSALLVIVPERMPRPSVN